MTIDRDELHAMLSLATTHKELQQAIRKVATDCGWRTFCWWSSMHSPKGWPDLVLVPEIDSSNHRAEIIFIECKTERGTVTPEQEEVHRMLRSTGHAVYVFRPSDWYSGRIHEVLTS